MQRLAGFNIAPQDGDLVDYVVTGELPLTVEIDGEPVPAAVTFELDKG